MLTVVFLSADNRQTTWLLVTQTTTSVMLLIIVNCFNETRDLQMKVRKRQRNSWTLNGRNPLGELVGN